jgi:hypothetical protein
MRCSLTSMADRNKAVQNRSAKGSARSCPDPARFCRRRPRACQKAGVAIAFIRCPPPLLKRPAMTRSALLPLLALGLLTACQSAPDPRFLGPPEQAPGVDACGAAELQDMVGDPRSILDSMRFAVPLRVITPGTAITADFQANRLNFEIGDDGTITGIACY